MAAESEATPPTSSPSQPAQGKEQASPLSRVPVDVAYHRDLIFALETPVQFDPVAWNKYWPFVDNIWCIHTKHGSIDKVELGGKIEKFWGGCRLERKWNHGGPNPETSRKRKRREMGQCQAKFRLTLLPNGVRILERSKEQHSHDLDYLDSVKRCTGIRGIVTDPFFSGWEPAGILAFLKDPAHHVDGHDLLLEGGGKYLERREILNVFTQTLRKAYPSIDPQAIKEAKDKYQGMKTCNFKGCNMAFPDSKALTQHRKTDHEEKKHDHSDKLYTCPNKQCHRRKRSKGFSTVQQLREHQTRMKHFGQGVFHGEDGTQAVQAVIEADGEDDDIDDIDEDALPTEHSQAQGQIAFGQGSRPQASPHSAMGPVPVSAVMPQHMPTAAAMASMMPLMSGDAGSEEHSHVLMDPNMQLSQPHGTQLQGDNDDMAVMAQRQTIIQRLHQLEMEKARMEQEMQRLRGALFVG